MRQVVLIVIDRGSSCHSNDRLQGLFRLIIEILHSDRLIETQSLIIDDIRAHVYFKFAYLVGDD